MCAVVNRRLYLLRHAKSSWKHEGRADHDRPLAGRGRRAAKAMRRYLREQGIAPELVLCSTATRARETFERLKPAAGDVRFERALYGARASELLARLHELDAAVASVMVIGHNPGLEELALFLAKPGSLLRELEGKFPTGALATLAVQGHSWGVLDRGTAELIQFVRPRDLE